jgi:cobalamin synthase
MAAQAPDRRTGRLAGAAGIALLLVGLTLLLEPA